MPLVESQQQRGHGFKFMQALSLLRSHQRLGFRQRGRLFLQQLVAVVIDPALLNQAELDLAGIIFHE